MRSTAWLSAKERRKRVPPLTPTHSCFSLAGSKEPPSGQRRCSPDSSDSGASWSLCSATEPPPRGGRWKGISAECKCPLLCHEYIYIYLGGLLGTAVPIGNSYSKGEGREAFLETSGFSKIDPGGSPCCFEAARQSLSPGPSGHKLSCTCIHTASDSEFLL